MRSLYKYLLIIIAIEISTVANAGSLIELNRPTMPCEGCYFAVFDKVQKDYQLTYITPNTPDMATIVKNKQEVLWVAKTGDYSPYWNSQYWKSPYWHQTSFKRGRCVSGAKTEYECASDFWSIDITSDYPYIDKKNECEPV